MRDAKILIVDDDEMNTRVAVLALDRQEYDIITARSGQEAIEKTEKYSFDLVLLDIMMPDMDGYSVCYRLKQKPRTEDIPIIFLTARTDVDSIRRAFECGGSDFVSKPFQKAELLARVDMQLRLKRHVEQIEAVSRERNQLLHILSHDLANPISASLAVVSLIEEDPDYTAEGLPLLRKSLQSGSEIIHFIRKIRFLEKAETTLVLRHENLSEMIDESAAMLAHLWKPKRQRLHREIDPALSVYVERNSFINSVAGNLLSNAFKFSHAGGEILITGRMVDEATAAFSVRDYGIGIPEEMIGNIFSFKSAARRNGTEGETGTGYGLPLVKRFVEAYGGSIHAESNGDGTLVICTLKGR